MNGRCSRIVYRNCVTGETNLFGRFSCQERFKAGPSMKIMAKGAFMGIKQGFSPIK
jgi:hypothetical protein